MTASTPLAVVWHDLECGSYEADLPLWLELARAHPNGAILDVGAGAGRVALVLARAGRQVVALDIEAELLDALVQRAGMLDVATVCADARAFDLATAEPIALCIAPMQTVQLLGGTVGRQEFLRCARAHVRPGGLIACALVTDVEPFDCTDGGSAPLPEVMEVGGLRYRSQPLRLEVGARTIAIERERRIEGSTDVEHDLVELDGVTAEELKREAADIGLRPEPSRYVPATEDHAGSTVVMLRV